MQESTISKKRKSHLGNKKPPPLNYTETHVSSKKIKILTQKLVQQKQDDSYLFYSSKLNEKLSSLFQNNENIRRLAADSLLEIATNYPEVIYENIDRVLSVTSSCWINNDSYIRRKIYNLTIKILNKDSFRLFTPFSEVIFTQIASTLSHINNDIRIDCLSFLNQYLFIEFGGYKENFITLQYLLGWLPLVCRITQSPSLYFNLNSLFIITVTTRELAYQVITKLRSSVVQQLYDRHYSELKGSLNLLFESLSRISLEIISKREQKYDKLSFFGLGISDNQSKKKCKAHNNPVRIKKLLIPGIPDFISNDSENILSLLTSLILDILYSLLKYGGEYIDNRKHLFKILNSVKKIQLELKDNPIITGSKSSYNSVLIIEKLLFLKLSSSPLIFGQNKLNIILDELIQECLNIMDFYRDFYHRNELLFHSNSSDLFEFIFWRGVEILHFNSKLNYLKKEFFGPGKYIFLNLIMIIINLKETCEKQTKQEFYEDITNVTSKELISRIKIINPKQFILDQEPISVKEMIQLLFIHNIIHEIRFVNEKNQLTSEIFEILVLFPLVLKNIGWTQNYCISEKHSSWSSLECIFVSFNEQLSLCKQSSPTKNDILIAKYWISIIPELIFYLYYTTLENGIHIPISIICNLLSILESYFNNQMISQLRDSSLTESICRSIMPLFINTKHRRRLNIISQLPFHQQKSIISTIPLWSCLPEKFLISIINQVLFFLENEINLLYSFYIIQVLISRTEDSNISLEVKMSIFLTLVQDCRCDMAIKLQLFNLLSEYFISLCNSNVKPSNINSESDTFNRMLVNNWLLPLISNLYSTSSIDVLTNTSIFITCVIPRINNLDFEMVMKSEKQVPDITIDYPCTSMDHFCNFVAFIPDIEVYYFKQYKKYIYSMYKTIILSINESKSPKKGDIERILSIEKLKYSILHVLFVCKAIFCFDSQNRFSNGPIHIQFLILNKTIEYMFKVFVKERKIDDIRLKKLFKFAITSIWWLFAFYGADIFASIKTNFIIEQIESYFKNEEGEYLYMCELFKERLSF
ncbi:Testis-expressed sequence 10 protein [Cryptosporidium felis]|nr:Testis-expressed sequence 10 protein [Cryptosporidium felis]